MLSLLGIRYETWCEKMACKFTSAKTGKVSNGGIFKLSGASGAQSSLLPR